MCASEQYVEIYRRRRSGDLFVQAFWNKPTGGATVQGNPVSLGSLPTDEALGVAVLHALYAFDRPYDREMSRRLAEWNAPSFEDKHDLVFIERSPTGETLVGPLGRVPGGFEGSKKTVRLSRQSGLKEMVAAIRKALSQAGTV
jgi:hypothetical protein